MKDEREYINIFSKTSKSNIMLYIDQIYQNIQADRDWSSYISIILYISNNRNFVYQQQIWLGLTRFRKKILLYVPKQAKEKSSQNDTFKTSPSNQRELTHSRLVFWEICHGHFPCLLHTENTILIHINSNQTNYTFQIRFSTKRNSVWC